MDIAYHTLTWANFYKDFDIDRELTEIQKAGFKGVEFVESLSKLGSVGKLKSKLKDYNITLVSLSCGLNMSKNDTSDIKEVFTRIDYAKEFGVKPIMICAGWLLEKRPKREDDFKLLAEKLETCSRHAEKQNMHIAFHPHKDTIVEMEADMDRLEKYLDSTKFCIDIAHLTWCGSDPARVIEKYKDNIVYMHLKDWSKRSNMFVELGKGDVRIDASFDAIKKIGYDGYLTVELDSTSSSPFNSAKISAEFLKERRLL